MEKLGKGPGNQSEKTICKKEAGPRRAPLCTYIEVPSTGQRRPALPRASPAVPSALGGLASGFGMGPGVPRPPWPLTGGRRSAHHEVVYSSGGTLVPWGPHSEEMDLGVRRPIRPEASRGTRP